MHTWHIYIYAHIHIHIYSNTYVYTYVPESTIITCHVCRLLKMTCLFFNRALRKRRYSAKEPYVFQEPAPRLYAVRHIHKCDIDRNTYVYMSPHTLLDTLIALLDAWCPIYIHVISIWILTRYKYTHTLPDVSSASLGTCVALHIYVWHRCKPNICTCEIDISTDVHSYTCMLPGNPYPARHLGAYVYRATHTQQGTWAPCWVWVALYTYTWYS